MKFPLTCVHAYRYLQLPSVRRPELPPLIFSSMNVLGDYCRLGHYLQYMTFPQFPHPQGEGHTCLHVHNRKVSSLVHIPESSLNSSSSTLFREGDTFSMSANLPIGPLGHIQTIWILMVEETGVPGGHHREVGGIQRTLCTLTFCKYRTRPRWDTNPLKATRC
jgi:hypothetical protein